MGLPHIRREKLKVQHIPPIGLYIFFSIVSALLEPRLLANQPPVSAGESLEHEGFLPQWQDYLKARLASTSKDGDAYAVLTKAGWVDMGQIFWITHAGDKQTNVIRIHPGVRLSSFEKTQNKEGVKSHTVLKGIAVGSLPELENLLEEKNYNRAGLDHVQFLVLHLSKAKNTISTRSVLFDSPNIDKDCPSCIKNLEHVYQWVDSNIKGQKK